ncbi:TPA: glycine-rich domain-containing protein, partial [Enterobacter roggenkampii]
MALTLLTANNAQTVLAAGISASATSLTVNSGTGALFPSASAGVSYFKLTLVDAATGQLSEIVHVTARSGDTMTITRGQEGTTARAWSANDIAANMLTAGTISLLAPLDSPALTGTPTVPTASPGTSTTQAASTAFVASAITAAIGRLINIQTPSVSGTYTPTSGTKFVIVRLQAAGGNGANAAATANGQV